MEEVYDVILVGQGPSNLSAGLYTSRSGLKSLILEYGLYGGQLNNTETIENYLGFQSIEAPELANEMYKSAMQFGLEEQYGFVERVTKTGNIFNVYLMGKESTPMHSKAVIVATGTSYKELGVKGQYEFNIGYCATCEGIFYKGKEVIVVGGGDSAFEEADYLTNYADKVTILYYKDKNKLKAKPHLQERVTNNDKISVRYDTEVTEIVGENGKIRGVIVNNEDGLEEVISTDGVFVYIGNNPQSKMLEGLDVTNENGYVAVDENMMTSLDGLFVAGDLVDKKIRQVANAVGEGAIAGQSAYDYLKNMEEL